MESHHEKAHQQNSGHKHGDEHGDDHCMMVPQVENMKHQHAFILLGQEQLFGVHMTQYHCELHKYQVILKFQLPDKVHTEFKRMRKQNPGDTFFLCNAKDKKTVQKDEVKKGEIPKDEIREFCVPDLGAGLVTEFTANIFQGIRPLDPEIIAAAGEHFFPWAEEYVKAAIGEFEVSVERVVMFRPFDHLHTLPNYALYLLFGDNASGETHMTNLQTARLITNAFEPPVFGPDYDHVMSLAERPKWLNQRAMLESGVVVSTPIVRLTDRQTGEATLPEKSPFIKGKTIDVLYRGIGPVRTITAGDTYLYSTAICNSPCFFEKPPEYNSYLSALPRVTEVMDISEMPKRYWVFAE